ncbi:hypothetical protein [Nocardia shimofusensis]|uniref:hypothetical protein n=1 Tax=Nocardia shimofusensis TaxID=228596 RepID=UPI00082B0949|nr:hypothetical protein [Nocardia shimofusensis]
MRRPRALVLDEVWRGLDGVEALSGPHGGPLRRTVKLILDPLVIRPVQYPTCAGAILTDDGATLLAGRVHAAADRLRATAAWFTLLKQVRRALRITEGNAQDLYFQRCFELAVTRGHPDPDRDRLRAEATLREIHEFAAGRTTQALKEHVTDPATAARLSALIETAWARRPGPITAPDHEPLLRDLLDAAVEGRTATGGNGRHPRGDGDAHRDRTASATDLFDAAVAGNVGTHTGIALWYTVFDGDDTVIPHRSAEDPGRIARGSGRELGLTAQVLPPRPEVGSSAATATLALPLDRSIHERVFTVLHASTERAELPTIPDLVTDEIARSCAPWALLDESLRATAAVGAILATGLAPLDRPQLTRITPIASARARDADSISHGYADGHSDSHSHRDGDSPGGKAGESAAHRVVNARWRREAYVLQARRLAVHTIADAPPDRDPLPLIAAELHAPWRPYLRRLWVRLHGRDVRGLPMDTPDELWDLLDGVARSVILDHRTRVKNALSATALAPIADTSESRAS